MRLLRLPWRFGVCLPLKLEAGNEEFRMDGQPANAGAGTGGRKAVARRCPPLEGILLLVFCPHVRNAPASGKKARLFRSFIFPVQGRFLLEDLGGPEE